MRKRYVLIISLFISIICSLFSRSVDAAGGVIISQVQIGDVSSSRLIEVYNNTDESIDITNWCVYHSSASDKTKTKLVCFTDSNPDVHLILRARSYMLVSSAQLIDTSGDFVMTDGLGGVSGGHIFIVDDDKVERDRVGWGTATNPETQAVIIGQDNIDHVLERVSRIALVII
jgi:hypothetical protein